MNNENFTPEEEQRICENISETNPLLNNLILSNVMKHLNIEDLKELRLANWFWKNEATILLKRKAFVTLDYSSLLNSGVCIEDSEFYKAGLEGWSPQLFIFIDKMSHFGMENFRVHLNSIHFTNKRVPSIPAPSPFLKLFEHFGHQIKSLEIICTHRDKSQLPKIKQLLSFKFTQLKKLVICVQAQVDPSETIWNDFNPEIQRSIEHLTFETTNRNSDNRKMDVTKLILFNLLKVVPNLKSLTVVGNKYNSYSCEPDVISYLYEKLKSFPKLNAVTLKINSPNLSKAEYFAGLPIYLRLVKIQIPSYATSSEIEKMFKKFAPHIEELNLLILSRSMCSSSSSELSSNITVNVPTFPKLKTLIVKALGWEESFMDFEFLGGELNYKRQFPMLTKLSLSREKNSRTIKNPRLYNAFFPENDQVVENLRILKVQFIEDGKLQVFQRNPRRFLLVDSIEAVEPFTIEIMVRLSNMFPNVQHSCYPAAIERYERLKNSEMEQLNHCYFK